MSKLRLVIDALRENDEDTASALFKELFSEKLEENLGNVITRAIPGVPDNGALIPNAYVTKTIPKKKKKLPSLKKSRYGTGMAPAGWRGEDFAGEGGSADGGGGDGGGGGE